MSATTTPGSECLFSGIVPIFVRASPGLGYPPVAPFGQYAGAQQTPYDPARRSDTINVDVALTPVINGRRSLEVRLADGADPFFMWQLCLGEEEFFVLKREQQLLLDFGRFPYKLIELLQACVAHGREEHPVYAAWLNVTPGSEDGRRASDAVLTITESTSMRQVPHLALRFSAVNEATMRRHLAEVLRQYRDQVDGLRTRLSDTHRYGYQPPGGVYTPDEYQSLADRYRALEERFAALEASTRGSAARPFASPPYVAAAAAFPPRPAGMSAMEAQLVGVEALAKEKAGEVVRLNDVVQGLRDAKRQLEDSLAGAQAELGRREAAGKEGSQEIAKANEIIRKLQEELRSAKSRLRSSEAFNRQHEKLAKDAQQAMDALRHEAADLRAALAAKQKEAAELEAEKRALAAELDAARRMIEANEKVIDWLHQQINQEQLEKISEEARMGLADFTQLSPDFWRRAAAAATGTRPDEASF